MSTARVDRARRGNTASLCTLVAAAAVVMTGVAALAQPASSLKQPQTDHSVTVASGARLAVENDAGEVLISGWDRDVVRVQARHGQRTRIAIRTVPTGISVSSSSSQGPGAVDYEINVPRWMPVKVDGHLGYIAIDGTKSDIAAETVRGDVVVKGGANSVVAKSVEGDVRVAGSRGRITVTSINQGVTVDDSSGDIVAETVNGPIKLTNIGDGNVEASTVNGHVTYDGGASLRGKYRFASHNGNIALSVPENASVAFSVRTYNGTLNTTLPLQRTGEVGKGRRVLYTLGGGSAEFELESFGGTIHLRRQGMPAPGAKDKKQD